MSGIKKIAVIFVMIGIIAAFFIVWPMLMPAVTSISANLTTAEMSAQSPTSDFIALAWPFIILLVGGGLFLWQLMKVFRSGGNE